MNKNNGLLLRKALLTALLSGTMTAEALLTGAVPVHAQPVATQSEAGKEEESKKVIDEATIKRMADDWKKIMDNYATYECNLPVEDIEALIEVEEYIENNYNLYFDDTLSNNFTVDEVLAYRNETNQEFSYREIIEAKKELDENDDKAVAEFLKKYGKRLAAIHANNYFTIYTINAAFMRDVAWYVKQDVEDTKWDELLAINPEVYDFKWQEYYKGTVKEDLSVVTLEYHGKDGINRNVTVDITAPNDDQELIGEGFGYIQTTYFPLNREGLYLGNFMNGCLAEEDEDYFLGYNTFAPTGTTTNRRGVIKQVYSIEHNDDINAIIKEGIRVEKTLSPWTTVASNIDGLNENTPDEYGITEYGFGHTFRPFKDGELLKWTYDEATKTYYIKLRETFEMPTLNYDDTIGKDPSYVKKGNQGAQ